MTRIWLSVVMATMAAGFWQDPGELLDLRTPAEMIRTAARDVATIRSQPGTALGVRYLDLSSIPPAGREHSYLVLSGHMQHLSRSSLIIRPKVVPGSGGSLLRIDLADYGLPTKTWEQLSDIDPYYHLRLKTLHDVPPYYYAGDASYPAGTYTRKTVTKTALAPWLVPTEGHKRDLAYLVAACGSEAPILRGDWFFYVTAAQRYYDFLGVRDVPGFERVIGFDRKLFDGFSVEVRASVAISGVTLQPRAIARRAALGGGYWTTYDFKAFKQGRNPLELLGRDIEREADASEGYGVLPNGFWATYAADGKGVLQQTVPPDIANDHLSRSNDKQIRPNISCTRCHYESGLKPISDWHRNLLAPPLSLNLGYDKGLAEVVQLRQQYATKLEPLLKKDRLVFETAVKEATGWDAKKYAQEYAKFYERRELAKVDLAWVERDTGVPKEKILAALRRSIAAGKGDPVLSVLALEGERSVGMPIHVWETAYPRFWELMTAFGSE